MGNKIKVLIVDDSLFIRQMVTNMLESEADIEVLGAAVDPYEAREMIKKLNPDVLTLDVDMPRMDGISFLEKLMKLRPMPVIMLSSLTQKGADVSIRALEIGAVDYVAKPLEGNIEDAFKSLKGELVEKIRVAASSKVRTNSNRTASDNASGSQKILECSASNMKRNIIAIGASTGGVEALNSVLTVLPDNLPPIVITQHMPAQFTKSFADRLNQQCKVSVCEVKDGEKLESGCVYVAPGGMHLRIKMVGSYYKAVVGGTDKISGHCPSVDALFKSVSEEAGDKALGVILTGMGSDGADGLLHMHNKGAITLGQNEATCVVYGMPKAAFSAGAVQEQVALEKISEKIVEGVMK
tara:strand:- start:297 stop:1355 length:1059 start_codon:yes stop_codon:yes gene_type:complete